MYKSSKLNKDKKIMVVYSPFEWVNYCRRPHILALKLYLDLLIIEPPVGLLFCWLHPDRIINYLKHNRKPRVEADGVMFYRPLTLGTYGTNFKFPFLAKIDRILVKSQINKVIKKLNLTEYIKITYINKVQQYYLMNLLECNCQIYEVTDEYLVQPGESKVDIAKSQTRKIKHAEATILSQANIVFASSANLCESRKLLNNNTYYIPNTADFHHFNKSTYPATIVPTEVLKIAKPRLGYIGNINELIDIELLDEILNQNNNYSIILIGNINGKKKFKNSLQFTKFLARPNVHYLGYKDYSKLPDYLKGIDICLLPFKNCEWMQNSFPNKIFQYMASGKPIVSTDFPAIRSAAKFAYIASDKCQFIEYLKEALREYDPIKIQNRINYAKANSTEARAKIKFDIISDYLLKNN